MDYRPAILAIAVTITAAVVVLSVRWRDWQRWRRSLVAYRLRLPDGLTVDSVSYAFGVISAMTARWPLALEVTATHRGIGHYVLIPAHLAPAMLTRFTTAIPSIRLDEAPEYLASSPRFRLVRELRTARRWRPLATQRGAQSVAGLLASMYPLGRGEVIRVQWIFMATRHVKAHEDLPAPILGQIDTKNAAPLVDACGRVAVAASHRSRAALLLSGVMHALEALSVPHSAFRARLLPGRLVARRVASRAIPATNAWWPALLNTDELAAVLAILVDGVRVPGLSVGSARQLPPPVHMRRAGAVVA